MTEGVMETAVRQLACVIWLPVPGSWLLEMSQMNLARRCARFAGHPKAVATSVSIR